MDFEEDTPDVADVADVANVADSSWHSLMVEVVHIW